MAQAPASALAINDGSSSIKFALYQIGMALRPLFSGKLDRIELGGTTRSWHTRRGW